MARPPKPAAKPENKLESDALDRLREARRWKESTRILDFKEAYFFLAPWRQRQISSLTTPSTAPMLDQPELYTDIGILVTADFVTELQNTYMPESQLWCERKAGEGFSEAFKQIEDTVKQQDKEIFAAIKSSNFYAELPKALNPDIVIAGAGMWIKRRQAHLPVECLAIPMREIEINLGPDGEIDDRFVVRYTYNKYVRALLGDDAIWNKLKPAARKKIEDNPTDRTQIAWGFWRLWEDISDEVWQHVILVDDALVHDTQIKGEGCCPFIVMRFGATADWPWAHGPALQFMPTMRQVDELERQKVEAVERSVNPAIIYPDDSFTEVEQGIEPGMAYPVRVGSEGAVKRIYDQPTIQPDVFEIGEMEKRLRKGFYVDYPEQTGDTPPTLGQWLDEMARAQRRIGTPGMSFWREGPRAIFLRFKFLLEKAGTIKPLTDKEGRAIATQPYNPAQRAAEQQEISTAVQSLQIVGQSFPEESRVSINGTETMKNIIEKMRTGDIVKFRTPGEQQAVLKQMEAFAGARREPGASDQATAPAGAPGPT